MNSCKRISFLAVWLALVAWLFIVLAPMQNTWAKNQAHAITLCTHQGFATVWLTTSEHQTITDFPSLKLQGKTCSLCANIALIVAPPMSHTVWSRGSKSHNIATMTQHAPIILGLWHTANPRAPPYFFA